MKPQLQNLSIRLEARTFSCALLELFGVGVLGSHMTLPKLLSPLQFTVEMSVPTPRLEKLTTPLKATNTSPLDMLGQGGLYSICPVSPNRKLPKLLSPCLSLDASVTVLPLSQWDAFVHCSGFMA